MLRGQRDDFGCLVLTHGRHAPAAGSILLDACRSLHSEAVPPLAGGLLRHAQFGRDVPAQPPVGGQQNDFCPHHQPGRSGLLPRPLRQRDSLGCTQLDHRRTSYRSSRRKGKRPANRLVHRDYGARHSNCSTAPPWIFLTVGYGRSRGDIARRLRSVWSQETGRSARPTRPETGAVRSRKADPAEKNGACRVFRRSCPL